MKIDLGAVRAGKISFADAIADIQPANLLDMAGEVFDALEAILANATDASILFVPHDAAAAGQSEQGWPVNHIIAHLTASFEEIATAASIVARGVQIKERLPLRYETPLQELSTLQLVQARLRESRRICLALLNAWPDKPHLDVTITLIPQFGPLNAIGLYIIGIGHATSHLDQLRDTIQQAVS